MIGFLTSRAEIETFGRINENEDIIPVEFEVSEKEISFRIKKSEFIYSLIQKSKVFAICVPMFSAAKQEFICSTHHGRFEDKFKLANLDKIECNTIDSPAIGKCHVYECEFLKEQPEKDSIKIMGTIIIERDI